MYDGVSEVSNAARAAAADDKKGDGKSSIASLATTTAATDGARAGDAAVVLDGDYTGGSAGAGAGAGGGDANTRAAAAAPTDGGALTATASDGKRAALTGSMAGGTGIPGGESTQRQTKKRPQKKSKKKQQQETLKRKGLCKWEQGEFEAEGCWAHRLGKCPFVHATTKPVQNNSDNASTDGSVAAGVETLSDGEGMQGAASAAATPRNGDGDGESEVEDDPRDQMFWSRAHTSCAAVVDADDARVHRGVATASATATATATPPPTPHVDSSSVHTRLPPRGDTTWSAFRARRGASADADADVGASATDATHLGCRQESAVPACVPPGVGDVVWPHRVTPQDLPAYLRSLQPDEERSAAGWL